MSALISPAAVAQQATALSTLSPSSLMKCLCQLQDQSMYMQMARAIIIKNLQMACRICGRLALCAPRRTVDSPDANSTSDGLSELFTALGSALDVQDSQRTQTLWQSLQSAVTEAHARHHGKSGMVFRGTVTNESTFQLQRSNHIDIKAEPFLRQTLGRHEHCQATVFLHPARSH